MERKSRAALKGWPERALGVKVAGRASALRGMEAGMQLGRRAKPFIAGVRSGVDSSSDSSASESGVVEDGPAVEAEGPGALIVS